MGQLLRTAASVHLHAQAKFVRLFAVDVAGQPGHDQFVYLVPNGLAIIGLAPSHALLRASKVMQAEAGTALAREAQAQVPHSAHSPQPKRQRGVPLQHLRGEDSQAGVPSASVPAAGGVHSQSEGQQQGDSKGGELPSPYAQHQAGTAPQQPDSDQQPQAVSSVPEQRQHGSMSSSAIPAQNPGPQRTGKSQDCLQPRSSLPFSPDQLVSGKAVKTASARSGGCSLLSHGRQ